MKSKFNTPAARLAEAQRLAVAFKELRYAIGELCSDYDDGFDNFTEVTKALATAEDPIAKMVGTLTMSRGARYGEWADQAESRQARVTGRRRRRDD